MKKFIKTWVLVFLAGLIVEVTFSQSIVNPILKTDPCINFDDLTVGGYVVEQYGGMWGCPWSPGNEYDAVVSDLYSVSPPNSMLVEGSTNVNLLFGSSNLTEGKYIFSTHIYISEGRTGYWNLQKDVVSGIEWGFQIMYDDDMTMVIDAGAQAAAIIPYEYDTWYHNEIIIDLDNDWCDFYIDGSLIVEYQWTLGVFGTPGANTLGSVNFFANPGAGGTPAGAHFDDVCFEEYQNPGCDNFDNLTVGGYVADQLGGVWLTWSGLPTDDAMVTDVVSNSPNNSFVVDAGTVDLIRMLDDEPISTGQHSYSHYMYVPTGFSGYFNVQTDPAPGLGWNLELYFDDGGAGHFAGQSTETFTYDQDTWFMVEINYDFASGYANVFFDGVEILLFENILTIGGIDYFGADTGGPPGAYYDDVCFNNWNPPPPLNPPTNLVVTITDCMVELTWDPPNTKDLTGYNLYRKFNNGPYTLLDFTTGTFYMEDDLLPCNDYYYIVTAVYDPEGESEPSNEAVAEIPCYPPQNLVATVFENVNVHLTCDPPVCGTPFSYNFYRDGNLIGGNEIPEFDHMYLEPGTYEYYATVSWGDEESEPSNTQIVTIEFILYPPTNLTGPEWVWEFQAISLTWEAPQEIKSKEFLHYNIYRSYNYDPYELIGNSEILGYEDWSEDLGVIEYYVTAVYDGGESDTTNHHLVDVIEGISENPIQSVQFFPNPATNLVNIKSLFTIESVKIYSFTGQEVIFEIVNKTNFKVNTSNFDPGLYLFQLDTKERRIFKRIAIN